jgi:ribosome-associated toxin RatA of RatAB toxin-antitoxin module
MARQTVTVSHTVHVNRSPEEVFDYTQDYSTRMDWDPTVKSAKVLSEEPRRVQVDMEGIGPLVIEYKLFRRGERTSAAFNDVRSRLIAGGGGSWTYDARDGGTDWTETSTLEFRNGLLGRLLAPVLRRNMRTLTSKAMAKAKSIMESGSNSDT